MRDGASTGSYRTLAPRTPVNRAPYNSVHALKADTATTAVYALQSGMVPDTLHADHATSAGTALLADQVGTAEFSSDAATLDGQPPEAFADANHTHTGAGIDDGTIDAVDLTSNPASLAKVTGGAASADTEGRIGIGTTAPIEMLDVRGSAVIEETLLLGNPVRTGVIYDQENGSLIIGEYRSGIDQQCSRVAFVRYAHDSPWQSFKAGVSGYLYRVQVYRYIADECTIWLRQGEGTGGTVLASGTLGASNREWQSFWITPPIWVSTDKTYTIHLTGRQVEWTPALDSYSRGRSSLTSGHLTFRTYVTWVDPYITIAQTGDVTINGTLTVRGEAYKPGGGAWASLSDSRTKTGIATISGALDKILQLRGVTFRWKDSASIGARTDSPIMGFIADEVEKVFPQWVKHEADGMRRLTLVGFEGLAIEALKEISPRHSEEQLGLEATLQALEEKTSLLEDFHESLRSRFDRLAELEARLDRLEKQKSR